MNQTFQNSKVIFFDMGNTLIDFHKGKSDAEKDNIGIIALSTVLSNIKGKEVTPQFVKSEFVDNWYAKFPERKILLQEFSIDDFLDPFLEKLNLTLSKQEKISLMIQFDSGYQQELVIEANLHNILKTLQKKFRIGVISNSPSYPEVNINHFEHLKIAQFFEHFIFSYSLQIAKPRYEIFNKAMELFNATPDQCIMVGDSLVADIKGAQQVKIKTIWLNAKQITNESNISPDFEIKTLSELISL